MVVGSGIIVKEIVAEIIDTRTRRTTYLNRYQIYDGIPMLV